MFAIIVDNSKLIICQHSIKINCSHILPANKNFTFTIFDIFFLFPAIFDNLPPYSPRSTVPVLGAQTGTVAPNTVPVSGTQTGTVNSPTADTVPVTVPVIVPVLGTKTGTVDASNPLCHKASPSPNIDKDKDKYFHSVNSSQYDSIRTDSSSKNGSIHNSTDYRIFERCNPRNAAAILFRFMLRLPHLIKVQPTEHCKNSVPYLVPPTAPLKGATHGTLQK